MKKIISLVLVLVSCMVVEVANADFTFGIPINIGPTVNSKSSDVCCYISVDSLQLYFFSERPGGFGNSDIWVTMRETIDDDWGTPLNLGPTVNSSYLDTYAMISADGLELYFTSTRLGGLGLEDIWVTRRESKDDTWGLPVNLGTPVNSSERDYGAFMSSDGLEFYFNSMRVSYHDIYLMKRASMSDDWGPPVNLGPVVNGPSHDIAPNLSTDGRYLFFSDHPRYGLTAIPIRSGGFGGSDIWVTSRPTISDDWGVPVNLGPMINTAADDCVPNLSPDGSTLYFTSNRPGGYGGQDGDIWQAPILPVIDFNGDGIIDAADMCILIDHWGENYSLCDIGPTPLGDGIIDVHDLIVLAEYLTKDFNDPTLLAHWALDETEGNVTSDSVNGNDATVYGNPIWQSTGGIVDGALQLDGVDDYISTGFILDPTMGAFSMFVWIKGGSPGQVVLSQSDGSDWLLTDTLEGKLMTDKGFGRGAKGLISQVNITDGNWHRIGFVWDGSNRMLYVDDFMVAEDTQTGLIGSNSGLNIGIGKNYTPNSYWSGLIDDVRIYNRAVRP